MTHLNIKVLSQHENYTFTTRIRFFSNERTHLTVVVGARQAIVTIKSTYSTVLLLASLLLMLVVKISDSVYEMTVIQRNKQIINHKRTIVSWYDGSYQIKHFKLLMNTLRI